MVSRTRKHKTDEYGRECTACEQYKLWSEYYAGAGANRKDTRCKACMCKKTQRLGKRPEAQAAERERWARRWEAAHPGEGYERQPVWLVDDEGRECGYSGAGNCGHSYKPWSEFYKRSDGRCRLCTGVRQKYARFDLDDEQSLRLELAAVYGKGLCDLHAGPETMTYQRYGGTSVRELCIDHDHSCGRHAPEKGCRYCIRGLVCCECNRTIIRMADKHPELAKRFADYLARRPLL